jgi:hypothetical protein
MSEKEQLDDGKDKRAGFWGLHIKAMIFSFSLILSMFYFGDDRWPVVTCAFCLAYLVGRKVMF